MTNKFFFSFSLNRSVQSALEGKKRIRTGDDILQGSQFARSIHLKYIRTSKSTHNRRLAGADKKLKSHGTLSIERRYFDDSLALKLSSLQHPPHTHFLFDVHCSLSI